MMVVLPKSVAPPFRVEVVRAAQGNVRARRAAGRCSCVAAAVATRKVPGAAEA